MGIWRDLGYGYAAITIIGGVLLLASGFSAYSRSSYDTNLGTGLDLGVFSQLGGLALIYGGFTGITLGIVLIWALVKSGQIESIDKNIEIIADWAKSQMQNEGSDDDELPEDEKSESAK